MILTPGETPGHGIAVFPFLKTAQPIPRTMPVMCILEPASGSTGDCTGVLQSTGHPASPAVLGRKEANVYGDRDLLLW